MGLWADAKNIRDKDPAARNVAEVIILYPGFHVLVTAGVTGKTGIEMEALTGASAACLTIYDMCKAVQKDILISDIHLLEKTGGVHGDYSYSGK